MTFLAESMVAAKGMPVPSPSSSASVRMLARSAFSSAVPVASLRSASAKVRVMSVEASLTAAPFAGRKVGAAGAVTSTVKVASAANPRLPAVSK